MGKMRMGILDGFVGKVGTVIGSFWKGRKVMRAYNEFPNDPNTAVQQLNRAKLKKAGALAGRLNNVLKVTYKVEAEKYKSTPVGEFIKKLWPEIHGTTAADVELPMENLPIALGNLTPVELSEPDFSTPATIECDITSSYTDSRINSDRDKVFLLAINAGNIDVMVSDGSHTRSSQNVTLTVPTYWTGNNVYVYSFVKGYELGSSPDAVSNSVYLGEGRIR